MHSNTYRRHYRAQFMKLSTKGEPNSIALDNVREKLQNQRGSLKLTDEQIECLLEKADANHDHRITLDEFETLMTSPDVQPSNIKRALYAVADQVITPDQRVDVHSYIDEYTLCPPPIFIILATLIEIGVFFYYYYTTTDDKKEFWSYCAGCMKKNHQPGIFIFAPKYREQAWRFGSYALLHAGFGHLISNCIMQLLVGVPLEIVHKMWRIGPLYIMAVISGALLQYAMDPNALLVGASGGVYALILAHLANVFLNWSEMPFRWVRIAILATFLSFDIGGSIYRRFFTDDCDMVSHGAHLAGGLTGFCFGVFILYNLVDHAWEKIVRWLCVALYVCFLIFTIIMIFLRHPGDAPLFNTDICRE